MKNLALSLLLVLGSYWALGANLGVARAPAGTIIAFAGSACPLYSRTADGTSQLRTGTYANLFAALGGGSSPWGLPDSTHFTVPNLQNRFLRGSGSATDGNGGTAVAIGGYQEGATHIYTSMTTGTESAAHSHGYTVWIGNGQNGGVDAGYGGGPFGLGNTGGANTGTESATHTHTVSAGAGDSETRPKAYGVNYCIYY